MTRCLPLLLGLSLLACSSLQPPPGAEPLARIDVDGVPMAIFADGHAYRPDGDGWSHVARAFDPHYRASFVERDGQHFKVGPRGKLYALQRRFACDFSAADLPSLMGVGEGKPGWTSFTLQSPSAKEVRDYVALKKRILAGEEDFRDSEIGPVDGVLRCVAVAPSWGMVCSKTSISTQLLRFVDGDEVWFRARYRLAPGKMGFATLADLEATMLEKHGGIRLCLRSGGKYLACELKWGGKPMYAQARGKEVRFPRDRWVTVDWALTLGENGRVRVWQDGALLIDARGRTLPLPFAIYDKLELGLSAHSGPETATLLVDDVEIADGPLAKSPPR